MSTREFEVSWDGKIRRVGRSTKGVLQGSPLSPVLFLVWISHILREMNRRIAEELSKVGVEFPSHVDNLHCSLYAGHRALAGVD